MPHISDVFVRSDPTRNVIHLVASQSYSDTTLCGLVFYGSRTARTVCYWYNHKNSDMLGEESDMKKELRSEIVRVCFDCAGYHGYVPMFFLELEAYE